MCIALVVSRDGFPLGYEVFAGNRRDRPPCEKIVTPWKSDTAEGRIWAMDRGMIEPQTFEWLQERGSRYIVGTPKAS